MRHLAETVIAAPALAGPLWAGPMGAVENARRMVTVRPLPGKVCSLPATRADGPAPSRRTRGPIRFATGMAAHAGPVLTSEINDARTVARIGPEQPAQR